MGITQFQCVESHISHYCIGGFGVVPIMLFSYRNTLFPSLNDGYHSIPVCGITNFTLLYWNSRFLSAQSFLTMSSHKLDSNIGTGRREECSIVFLLSTCFFSALYTFGFLQSFRLGLLCLLLHGALRLICIIYYLFCMFLFSYVVVLFFCNIPLRYYIFVVHNTHYFPQMCVLAHYTEYVCSLITV